MAVADRAETTRFLAFKLCDEVSALGITKVREVLDFTTVTRSPRTPDFMLGVINLRGSVIPIVDLRIKFGMSKTEKAVNTCVIITEVDVDAHTSVLGAGVARNGARDIAPAPMIGTKLKTEFIRGMGKREDRFVILLDIDKAFSSEELVMVGRREGVVVVP
jgi:purine-binding chemotaxis protein CheW